MPILRKLFGLLVSVTSTDVQDAVLKQVFPFIKLLSEKVSQRFELLVVIFCTI